MPNVVLDASAVLALQRSEPGTETVADLIGQAVISTVDLQEVMKDLLVSGLSAQASREIIEELRLDIRDHDREAAYAAADPHEETKKYGRGLGDRSCLALELALACPVVTVDRGRTGRWTAWNCGTSDRPAKPKRRSYGEAVAGDYDTGSRGVEHGDRGGVGTGGCGPRA